MTKKKLRVLPLGGLGEIGMNIMVIQYGYEAVLVDCGIMFSDDHLPGIDLVVPDFSVLQREGIKPLALLLTHGHEDHIGAVPYFLREMNVPVYGSRFTMALVKEKLREHQLLDDAILHQIKEGDTAKLGPFNIEFIRMAHSIADALAIAIGTPEGLILHTGDFKLDDKPSDGRTTDLNRFKELGKEGVFLLLSDSTNVEIPGKSVSESSVRAGIEKIVQDTPGWVIVASFASHIPRLKQVIDIALKEKRKLLLAGRSMVQNVGLARGLGLLEFPDTLLVDIERAVELPRNKLMILSTGTQGEPRSALARMSVNQFKELRVKQGDRVIMSSRFIPGNERLIFAIINHLYRRGAEVFTTLGADVHVSGHAYRDDLEKVLRAVQPKYFVPVHGEYRHLVKHIQLAQETGVPKENTFLLEDGIGAEFVEGKGRILQPMELSPSVVDGKELGDIGSDVLRDRRHLSETGMVVAVLIMDRHSGKLIRGPELFAKGVAFEDRMEDLIVQAKEVVRRRVEEFSPEARTDDQVVAEEVRLAIRRFFKNRLDRKPVVIPIVLEV